MALSEKPMLNLTGISNTDLKLEYGTANLELLSQYDTNFTNFVALLPEFTEELQAAGHTEHAQTLLEFAVSVKADSRKIYKQLADIYVQKQQSNKLEWLMESAKGLPTFAQNAIIKELSSMN